MLSMGLWQPELALQVDRNQIQLIEACEGIESLRSRDL